jgi:hypothetical protein
MPAKSIVSLFDRLSRRQHQGRKKNDEQRVWTASGPIPEIIEADPPTTVYLIEPSRLRMANDVQIMTEDRHVLCHVKSKLLSPLGRQYSILGRSKEELLVTKQDHTAIFPRHRIMRGEEELGKVGQASIIPLHYFVELTDLPRAEIHVNGSNVLFSLKTEETVFADLAQDKWAWVVIIEAQQQRFAMLAALSVIYRDTTLLC